MPESTIFQLPAAGSRGTETPLRRRPIFVGLMLLFVFPAGLWFVWNHPSWSKNRKWTLTGIAGAFFLLMLINAANEKSGQQATSNDATSSPANPSGQTSDKSGKSNAKSSPAKLTFESISNLSPAQMTKRFGEPEIFINPKHANVSNVAWKVGDDQFAAMLVIRNLQGGADIHESVTRILTRLELQRLIDKANSI